MSSTHLGFRSLYPLVHRPRVALQVPLDHQPHRLVPEERVATVQDDPVGGAVDIRAASIDSCDPQRGDWMGTFGTEVKFIGYVLIFDGTNLVVSSPICDRLPVMSSKINE